MEYKPRLKNEYIGKIISNMKKEFGYENVMQVPRLKKIVVSKGVGAAVADKKLIDHAVEEKLFLIFFTTSWKLISTNSSGTKPEIDQ